MHRPPNHVWIAVICLVMVGGCAKRTDAQIREVWSAQGEQDETLEPEIAEDDPDRRGPRNGSDEPRVGWERVSELMERAVRILSRSPGAERFERLAERWCEVVPNPRVTEHGDVRVCFPRPPVEIAGRGLVLEMGTIGTIALVADELGDARSSEMIAAARDATGSLCATPFAPVVPLDREVARRDEFHTCPVSGGSTLAIGRTPTPGTEAWQVSIAVLGAH